MANVMNKKSGSKCFKSVAMLAVLCVVLVGCSGSSDRTDATVLAEQQATNSAGVANASAGSTVASSIETEPARTSPSSLPAASSADDSEEAGFQDSTPATTVIPSTTTIAPSSTIDDVHAKPREEALVEFLEWASSRNASDKRISEFLTWALSEIAIEQGAVIRQPTEPDETPTEETEEEIDSEDECQTPKMDTAETTNDTVLTDVIQGMIISSEDGEPLRLDFVYVQTYPGFWAPFDRYHEFEVLFVLNIELRDATGATVYCAPISVLPSSNGNFWVRIPNPPDYDRIAIVNSGEDIGEVWRSLQTPIVEDLMPEYGSIFCYDDVIKGIEYIRVKWKNVDRDHYILPFLSPFHKELANHIWISTDGGSTYQLIWRGTARGYTFHPADFYNARDVYVRVHISDSTRTSYSETYFKFDPSACSPEQQFLTDEETSPKRQHQKISEDTECELSSLNPEDEQNEEKLNHTIDAKVYLSRKNDPIGLSSFQVEVLAVPRPPSEPSAGGTHRRGTIEFRDESGQNVDSFQYIVFWPSADYFPLASYGEIDTRTPYNSGYFVSGSIPDPANYESIAVLYDGEEIGVFHKSSNSPVVEIVSPNCGEVYQSGDMIRMTWYGYDLDGDDLDYEVWYSTDERASYRRAYLDDDYTFKPYVSFKQEDFSGRIYVRVHVTDGFLTDHAETYFEISEGETSEAAQE